MELTGKCKEDFEKWRKKQNYNVDAPYFYELKYSMQYGVYVDFFDSVGIEIEITKWDEDTWQCLVSNKKTLIADELYDMYSRLEARTAAITKANEIYNGNEHK